MGNKGKVLEDIMKSKKKNVKEKTKNSVKVVAKENPLELSQKKESKQDNQAKIFSNINFVKKIALAIGSLVLFVFGLFIIYNGIYSDRIFPQTYLGQVNLGGKTKEEAKQIIEKKASEFLDSELKFVYDAKEWKLEPKEIGLTFDTEKTIDDIWAVGRQGNIFKVATERLKVFFSSNHIDAKSQYNEEKFAKFISIITDEIDIKEKNATIVVEDLQTTIQDEETGQKVNKIKLLEDWKNNLVEFKNSPIILLIEKAEPAVTAQNTQLALAQTKKILGQDILLRSDKKLFTLSAKEFSKWLVFKADDSNENIFDHKKVLVVDIDEQKLSKYVVWLASEIDQETRDAKFEVKDGHVTVFATAQTGFELDQNEAKKIIKETILKAQDKADLPVKEVKPEVTSNSASQMGIKEIVAEGFTNFSGSPSNRRHNITVGAKALHGIVVKPGEEFSTVKRLKPIDASGGYLPELVIKENRTTPEYGGGLCQVSTTLFRAVMNAGLEVSARSNHSYRVGYYEPPVGMDATIYDPSPDFKFINNMDSPILLQSKVEGNNITFTIYGTKDGRQVEISKPVVYGYEDPEPPLYVESPNLAPGEIKQVESAHKGAKAYFTYKVTKAGKTLSNDTFKSNYVPWRARFLYGPGTEIPKNSD